MVLHLNKHELHPRMLRACTFVVNWPIMSRNFFWNFVNVFQLFYLLLETGRPLNWTNPNPLHQGCFNLCQVWLKLTKRFKRRTFINFVDEFFFFFSIMSLWKRAEHLFEQDWIPLTWGCFVPSLVEIGPVAKLARYFPI